MISKSKPVTLATAQLLTDAYALLANEGATGVFDVRNNEEVTIEVTYEKNSDTGAKLRVEGTMDKREASERVWVPAEPAADLSASLTAGVFETPIGHRVRTLDTSGTLAFTVAVAGFHAVRIMVIGTAGGTPDGTIGARITAVQS